MKNRLFDAESLAVVLAPESWRIVSSLFEEEVPPVMDRRHTTWMADHVDRHPAREVLVALKGRGVYGFRGRVYPCRPGTVFLFDAHEPHDDYYAPGCPAVRHLWLRILENDVLVRILDAERGRIAQSGKWSGLLSGTAAAALLIATWNDLAAAPLLPEHFRRAALVAALAAILAQIAGEGYRGRTQEPTEPAFAAAVIRTIQRHVEEHAGRGIPLGEAARLAGYSKFHFIRLFKQYTGLTYHAYVDVCRLKRATMMLAQGRRKKDVAETLGFSHPSAFLRWMKTAGKVQP